MPFWLSLITLVLSVLVYLWLCSVADWIRLKLYERKHGKVYKNRDEYLDDKYVKEEFKK